MTIKELKEKECIVIERLKIFEPEDGYYLACSLRESFAAPAQRVYKERKTK